jgi:hypothetical protein
MSEERFDQDTEAKDENDVEAHKKHSQMRNVEAKDEPGNDESEEVEAHMKRNV